MTVYTPREDSFLLQTAVKKYSKNKRVLDMGTGSGIQAQTALKAGAKSVIASEIDKGSLKLLRDMENSVDYATVHSNCPDREFGTKSSPIIQILCKFKENKKIKIIESDLFKNIGGKFGVIAFNPPYLPEDKREDKESARATSGGKKGDEILLRFLKQARAHLEKNGIILLVVSSLTPQDRIIKLIKYLNLSRKIICGEKFFMETLEVWEIRRKL